MQLEKIPVVTVSYNTPHLLRGLLSSLRQFYGNPVHVVDGSDAANQEAVRAVVAEFENVQLHAQGHNIHHGPGLAWALEHLPLDERVLIVDSDVVVLKPGFLEAMAAALQPRSYGVGALAHVNSEGFDVPYDYAAVPYLHPALMLCNVAVMKRWPLPIKHGAPMINTMLALKQAGKSSLLQSLDWAVNDVIGAADAERVYVNHLGRGTVRQTGSYNLDEWMAGVQGRLAQGPAQRSSVADLLSFVPASAMRIAEVGGSAGALAQALKAQRADVHYRGFEIDATAAALARSQGHEVQTLDIEAQDDVFWRDQTDRDCWILGEVLEQLREPGAVLERIREQLPAGGSVVLCVNNAQHWSLQARLCIGDLRYEAAGLLDRQHLRWFSRSTLIEQLSSAGLRVEAGAQRLAAQKGPEPVLAAIRQMALAMGRDPEGALRDAIPLQYLMRAVAA